MPKTTKVDLLRYEMEGLGYIHSFFPNLSEVYYFVLGFSGRNEQFFDLYQLKTGQTKTIRYRKKTLEQNPTEAGDIIKVIEEEDEGRWKRDDNNKWYQDWSECAPVLKKWSVCKK